MLFRRRGFTLIELLVVIAIIGILAAMLFPVFARARESARKIQCLSNVKNLAMAYQMYLTDYDAFPPVEKRAEVLSYWGDVRGVDVSPGCCPAPTTSNPYLKIPVILDEYVKNRDVWTCPSARLQTVQLTGMAVNPCVPDWFTAMKAADECRVGGTYANVFPPGWGGSVTDTNQQGCSYGEGGTFNQNYGSPWAARGLKMSQLRDTTKYVVIADAGFGVEAVTSTEFALPDLSKVDSVASACGRGDGYQYGEPGCDCCNTFVTQCSVASLAGGGDGRISLDAGYRRSFARHMGGENMGFADGHAKWLDEEVVLFGAHDHSQYGMHPQVYYGVDVCFNASTHSRECATSGRCNDSAAGDY